MKSLVINSSAASLLSLEVESSKLLIKARSSGDQLHPEAIWGPAKSHLIRLN